MDKLHFVYPFIDDGHVDGFHFSAIANNAAMNTDVQVFG